jgi:hypothetical protein
MRENRVGRPVYGALSGISSELPVQVCRWPASGQFDHKGNSNRTVKSPNRHAELSWSGIQKYLTSLD